LKYFKYQNFRISINILKINQRNYQYLGYIQAIFVSVLIIVNLVAANKIGKFTLFNPASIFGFSKSFSFEFTAGLLFFPISYLIGNILTEVYGYSASRRVIWSGFGCLILVNLMIQIILMVPPAQSWELQSSYQEVFSSSFRISLSSMLAYAAGEFVNSYSLAKFKLITNGAHLWTRTIGSTILGEAIDTLIFYPLAFGGDWTLNLMIIVMKNNYIAKVVWEIFATPLTYFIVDFLKKSEQEDFFDRKTNFSPWKL